MLAARTKERRDAATFRKSRGRRLSGLRRPTEVFFARSQAPRPTPPPSHTIESSGAVAWLVPLSGAACFGQETPCSSGIPMGHHNIGQGSGKLTLLPERPERVKD